MVSSTLSSFVFVFLFSVCLVHSTPSLFGTGNVYVAFSLDSGYENNQEYGATLYDLNLGYSIHVNYLDWTSFSADIIETAINQTTGDSILLGKTDHIKNTTNYSFKISQVFVVLPGSTAQPFDEYFTSNSQSATTVNAGNSISIKSIDLELDIAFLDEAWVNYRISNGDAVVQGHVIHSPRTSTSATTSGNTLVADRVFISLPDQTTPCIIVDPINCPNNEVFTYNLTPNRCLVPASPPCTRQSFCPLFVPFCPPPYFLLSFPSTPNGCNTFYCFPEFVNLH